MDLCLCFLIHWVCHSFPSKEQASLNFMPAATISSDFAAPKIKICHSFQFFPYLPWSDGNRCLRFLNVEFQTSFFQSSLSPSSQGSLVLLCFLPGGIICISEAIDISPGHLDSSLCFTQPGILHAYKLNKQDDNIQPWCTPFPIWNQSAVPCTVLTVASWPAYRFLRRQIDGLAFPFFEEFSKVCCDPHSQSL